jgi:GNAT superfamily N-acetyltransferase
MVLHAEAIDLLACPALVACTDGSRQGLATYRRDEDRAELVSLDAVTSNAGVGTALLLALAEKLRGSGVRRLQVTTTNDNLAALRFYQKRGFRLSALRPAALEQARRLKPFIPEIGNDGVPIRDELDLLLEL